MSLCPPKLVFYFRTIRYLKDHYFVNFINKLGSKIVKI